MRAARFHRSVLHIAVLLAFGAGSVAADNSAPTHWAYVAPSRPVPPAVQAAPWPRGPLDRFVLQRLESEGLAPSPEAGRATLLRRVTLDLTGLPPTPAESDAFLADPSPDAYERAVDRLLASPRYGERMAWEWLEAARYADSNGYQGDGERTMWPWRDWVVSAMNRNLPFDAFTEWQLAGDLLPGATREQKLATGFCRNHMINGEGGRIAEENRIDYLFDQTETTATVWLGATFNCTRCHDHKYDPFTMRDYYGLLAFFNRTAVDGGGGDPQSKPNLEAPTDEHERQRAELGVESRTVAATIAAIEGRLFPRPGDKPAGESESAKPLPEAIRRDLAGEPARRGADALGRLEAHWRGKDDDYARALSRLKGIVERRAALDRSVPRVMVMEDVAKPRETFRLLKGAYNRTSDRVDASMPARLVDTARPPRQGDAANRLDLARWLVSPGNPLASRVAANRAWQLFFGTGLVKTSEDFGTKGEAPSHPALLDWLATEYQRSGWDTKHLHRLIATSATYRQSSRATAGLLDRDPENRLLARGPRHRMPSWMIRDTALQAAGLLAGSVGGPPVKPYQPGGVWEEATFGAKRYEADHGAALYRRSLYVFWRRIVGPTMFFDAANRQYCTVRTARTDTPLQALLLLNDTGYVEAARVLAGRAMAASPETGARIDVLYRRVLGRRASAEERAILAGGLARHRERLARQPEEAGRLLAVGESARPAGLDAVEHAAWTLVAGTVLNLDEAISKE